ncbi:hypothetical protein C9994_03815 [Marivirga lumbricoides]|uniref:Beta-glucuronidase n=1 Tax=Marivirga lumbricoides TaxID=1046115 RepID=A0A2T4DTW0_9BACT|nr:hypothetical protein C9994_03815 [Marivirga lumbricoides]
MKYLNLVWLIAFSIISNLSKAQESIKTDLLQNIQGRNTTSLNGMWEIIVDPLENGYYNHRYKAKPDGYFINKKMESPSDLIEYDFDSDWQISVPGDWNTQFDKLYYYEGTVWYKRDFHFNGNADEEAYLYFEAVNYEATVYLNGEKLGTHVGGYTPFQFDVNGKLKEGENFVVVKVDNKRKREAVPTINTDWWNYGGITRSVHLITVPKKHIFDYSIQLANNNPNLIEGWVTVKNGKEGEEVAISIPELKKSVTAKLTDGKASFSIKAKPVLWSPSNPKLYEVNLSLGNERITDRIGFRTIKTEGAKIVLNGKPVFLKGISIHEEAPFKTGRVVSVEDKCLEEMKVYFDTEMGYINYETPPVDTFEEFVDIVSKLKE